MPSHVDHPIIKVVDNRDRQYLLNHRIVTFLAAALASSVAVGPAYEALLACLLLLAFATLTDISAVPE